VDTGLKWTDDKQLWNAPAQVNKDNVYEKCKGKIVKAAEVDTMVRLVKLHCDVQDTDSDVSSSLSRCQSLASEM